MCADIDGGAALSHLIGRGGVMVEADEAGVREAAGVAQTVQVRAGGRIIEIAQRAGLVIHRRQRLVVAAAGQRVGG